VSATAVTSRVGLWEDMKGFSSTKVLLNRRIVAPLSHSELAERIGLRAPAAVMLFVPRHRKDVLRTCDRVEALLGLVSCILPAGHGTEALRHSGAR